MMNKFKANRTLLKRNSVRSIQTTNRTMMKPRIETLAFIGCFCFYFVLVMFKEDISVFPQTEFLKAYRRTTLKVTTNVFERGEPINVESDLLLISRQQDLKLYIQAMGNSTKYNFTGSQNFTVPRSSDCDYMSYLNLTTNTKWFIYSPSGGFNNQRMELEYALHIGRLLNRSILAPMAAPHTSLWTRYQRLKADSLFPMDRILDFQELETYGTKICPLNEALSRVIYRLTHSEGKDILHTVVHEHRERNWHGKEVVKYLSPIKSKVLFLKGPTMFHPWFPPEILINIRARSRYTQAIRDLAVQLANSSPLNGHFNAVHVRLGDRDRLGWHPKMEEYASIMIKRKFSFDMPLYIATEPEEVEKRPEFFKPLTSRWNVTFAKDLPKDLVYSFRAVFPEGSRDDMFGMLEQLLCSYAYGFKGTGYSRFTQYIVFIRRHRETLFPETKDLDFNVGALTDGVRKSWTIKY